jgi:hypothetical protein
MPKVSKKLEKRQKRRGNKCIWVNTLINLTNPPINFVKKIIKEQCLQIIWDKTRYMKPTVTNEIELNLHSSNKLRVVVTLSILGLGLWLLNGMPI